MIAIPLYLICLGIELVYVIIRAIATFLVVTVLGWDPDTTGLVTVAVGVFPLLWSVATLFGLPGGWGLMWELGARRPSRREKATVKPALAELRRRGARRPLLWFVVDDPTPSARVIGRTIYVHSSLIDNPYLTAVLAHECGHIGTLGSQMLLALTRLEFPGLRALRVSLLELTGDRPLAGLVRTLSGGASSELPIIRTLWRGHFRRNERLADRVVQRLGYGPEFAAFLDAYERPVETASAFRRGRTHPFAEHRIGRLDP